MRLDEKDQITYLANVIFVVNSDGVLSAKETAALDGIRVAIGAKKGALNAAVKLAQAGGYTLTRPESFVAQVSNLADMLYVCAIDGELPDSERALVSDFSKKVNLSEEQLLLLTKEAIQRIKGSKLSVLCSSCRAAINPDLKFCPHCGTALNSRPRKRRLCEIQSKGASGRSRSWPIVLCDRP